MVSRLRIRVIGVSSAWEPEKKAAFSRIVSRDLAGHFEPLAGAALQVQQRPLARLDARRAGVQQPVDDPPRAAGHAGPGPLGDVLRLRGTGAASRCRCCCRPEAPSPRTGSARTRPAPGRRCRTCPARTGPGARAGRSARPGAGTPPGVVRNARQAGRSSHADARLPISPCGLTWRGCALVLGADGVGDELELPRMVFPPERHAVHERPEVPPIPLHPGRVILQASKPR